MRQVVVGALLALYGGVAGAQTPVAWEKPTEPFQVSDNLYYVGTEGLSSWLLTSPQGHVLIDGAMPSSGQPILASIRKLGFKPTDVKVILNTHAHFDHSGGLAELKRSTGAKLAASAGDVSALEAGKYLGSEEVKAFDAPPVKVDRVLKDGDEVTVGLIVLTAHVTPGHTRGCTTWTFPLKVEGKTKQALLYCSTSVAANRLVSKDKGPQYPGIVDDYEKTFARLKAMRADVFLAPHAEQMNLAAKRGKGAGAFVNPGELQTVVAASEAAFRRDLARQQEAAK